MVDDLGVHAKISFLLPTVCDITCIYTVTLTFDLCQEPREFNLFLQIQIRWNQRKLVKINGLFLSKDEPVDVFLEGNE